MWNFPLFLQQAILLEPTHLEPPLEIEALPDTVMNGIEELPDDSTSVEEEDSHDNDNDDEESKISEEDVRAEDSDQLQIDELNSTD